MMNEEVYVTVEGYNRKIEILEKDDHIYMRLYAPDGVTLRPLSDIWILIVDSFLLDTLRDLTWGEFKGLKMALEIGIHADRRSRNPGYVEPATLRGLLGKGLVAQSSDVNSNPDLVYATSLGKIVMGFPKEEKA